MSNAALDLTTVRRWKRYPEYRVSGSEWMPRLPIQWHTKRLKFLAATSRRRLFEKPADSTYVGLEQIESKTGKLLLDNPVEAVESNMGVFEQGDVLFGKLRPYLAKVASPSFAGVCTTELTVYRPRPEVDGDYLKYQLLSADFIYYINALAYGTKMPRVSEEQMGEVRLVVPSVTEQRAIAAFLDRETARVDALIGHKERLIALLEEKRQAVISRAVVRGLNPAASMKDSGVQWLGKVPSHWKVMRIADATRKITNGFVGPTRDILLQEGDRYLQSLHIKDGQVRFEKPYYVSPEWSREHAKSILKVGDVLIVQTGACVGQVAAVPKEFEGANCHALIIVQMKPIYGSGFFLSTLLNSQFGQQVLLSTQEGATLPHLECGKVREILLAFPPLEEQIAIVTNLDRAMTQNREAISKIRDSIARLQEYRTALISAAVTGQIDVRGEVTP